MWSWWVEPRLLADGSHKRTLQSQKILRRVRLAGLGAEGMNGSGEGTRAKGRRGRVAPPSLARAQPKRCELQFPRRKGQAIGLSPCSGAGVMKVSAGGAGVPTHLVPTQEHTAPCEGVLGCAGATKPARPRTYRWRAKLSACARGRQPGRPNDDDAQGPIVGRPWREAGATPTDSHRDRATKLFPGKLRGSSVSVRGSNCHDVTCPEINAVSISPQAAN